LSYLVKRETNKQTNKVWQKHYLLSGGNYYSVANKMSLASGLSLAHRQ